ncbi:MAG TPA: hypothetical protein DD727_05575 [Clostridiales bacterium]|nr:hypothetical protein [Clostridiales bacterium]
MLLAQATHREPIYLKEILARLPGHLNEKGYMGRVLEEGVFDEQQMAGNSWLLRALIEYWLWKKDDRILAMIRKLVQNLILPLQGHGFGYPSRPEERIYDGESIGHLAQNRVRNWHLSSDIGCLFILLDGASHAYEILRDPELGAVLEKMILKFSTIDLVGLSFQIHATLSALRGILRYYECTEKQTVLELAEKIFSLYMVEGITENYANYNWFGRPCHTEPCAMIDSFIAAFGLWKNTGKPQYLDHAHHIWVNSIEHGQRPNGGFGCDTCSGDGSAFLGCASPKLYEAFWCCTMRGGEGLSRAVQYSWMQAGDELLLPFYYESTVRIGFADGEAILKETAGYPRKGSVQLEVIRSDTRSAKKIRMFLPLWADPGRVKLTVNGQGHQISIENGFVGFEANLVPGTRIILDFPIELRQEAVINRHSSQGYHTYRHGTLILGIDQAQQEIRINGAGDREPVYLGNGNYLLEDMGVILSPLNDGIHMTPGKVTENKKQILFADQGT